MTTKLHKPRPEDTHNARISLISCTVLVILFIVLAHHVRRGLTLTTDEKILRTINSYGSSLLDPWIAGVTELASLYAIPVITIGIVVLLWFRKKRDVGILLLFAVGGAGFINSVLKLIYERQRPELWDLLTTEQSSSFPSWHAMTSSALAVCIIIIFWNTRWRWPAIIVSVVYASLIGFSRVYLGVHYPSDVLAGWMASVAWVLILHLILRKHTQQY